MKTDQTGTKLPLRTKLGFGVADLGGNLFFTAMGFWSLNYLTDTVAVACRRRRRSRHDRQAVGRGDRPRDGLHLRPHAEPLGTAAALSAVRGGAAVPDHVVLLLQSAHSQSA